MISLQSLKKYSYLMVTLLFVRSNTVLQAIQNKSNRLLKIFTPALMLLSKQLSDSLDIVKTSVCLKASVSLKATLLLSTKKRYKALSSI